jgi:hypothetical protein
MAVILETSSRRRWRRNAILPNVCAPDHIFLDAGFQSKGHLRSVNAVSIRRSMMKMQDAAIDRLDLFC